MIIKNRMKNKYEYQVHILHPITISKYHVRVSTTRKITGKIEVYEKILKTPNTCPKISNSPDTKIGSIASFSGCKR